MTQLQESSMIQDTIAPTGTPRRRRGALAWLPLAAALALLTLLAVAVLRPTADDPLSTHNRPATDFTMALYHGGTLDTRSLRGKTIVVNFWWSGCDPCKQEAALLEQSWRKWKNKGVVFVGVDEQDDTMPAGFLRAYHVTYPNGKDPNYVNIEYGATGQPETVFISPRGIYTRKYASQFPDAATLDRLIAEARA